MSGTQRSGKLTDVLETARRELLDLGLRNPLLNYRLLRGKGLEVVDEKPSELFRVLVQEEKNMTFLPVSGHVGLRANGDDLEQPEEDTSGPAALHTDLRLQTNLTSAQLQNRLLATYYAARSSIEEQGVNTLYLALGMLNWRDEDNSEDFCRAPLVLVPVELARSDARERFHIGYTGDELAENVSLAEKLKQSFAIKFPPLPDPEDLDVDDYFRAVERSVISRAGWSVDRDAVALGFFSFAKFLMYRDLDARTWAKQELLALHPILRSLIGDSNFAGEPSGYDDKSLVEDQLRGPEPLHVVDADSSQMLALLDVLGGRNLIIQGPPGTGKSQTIVNLIAAALSEGKTVLFVSEKMAALEVVKRRLDQVQLGGACLEIHSNKTNKKAVIEELKRTVSAARIGAPNLSAELALLEDTRNRLNGYSKAVNDPIRASGETPCSAYGKLLLAVGELKDFKAPPLALSDATDWSTGDAARRTSLVEHLQDRLSRSGVPQKHPFWGSRLMLFLPTEQESLLAVILQAQGAAALFACEAAALSALFGDAAPATATEADKVCESVRAVVSAPDVADLDTRAPEWRTKSTALEAVIHDGREHRRLRKEFSASLRPEAWDAEVTDIRRDIDELGGRWWRVLSGRWRRAQVAFRQLCAGQPPSQCQAQLELLGAIMQVQRFAASICDAEPEMKPLFRDSWRGLDSDWDLFEAQATWIRCTQEGVEAGTLANWSLDAQRFRSKRDEASWRMNAVAAAGSEFRKRAQAWIQRLEIDETLLPAGPVLQQPFAELAKLWGNQASRISELSALVAVNQAATECEHDQLAPVVRAAEGWEHASNRLITLFTKARVTALLDVAFRERPAIAGFEGLSHGKHVETFRRLDKLCLKYNQMLLAAQHSGRVPFSGNNGQAGILQHEFERKRRFLPIRRLMEQAGNAVQAIKPVFMMSPLSIANFLPPGAVTFDLVVFDEASQVRPVDALGAIVRGNQVVVVGDSQQLPPTTFFDSLIGQEEDDEESDDTATTDIESILGLFRSRGAPQRMLRWHYRSRHESLIALSNHVFYDDQLVVFPSPNRERTGLGLGARPRIVQLCRFGSNGIGT